MFIYNMDREYGAIKAIFSLCNTAKYVHKYNLI